MSAGHGLLGRRIGRFFLAAATAVALFLGAVAVFDNFPSLGGVQLTKGPKQDPTKCKDSDPNDNDQGGGNSGKGPKSPGPRPRPNICLTPSPSPSPTVNPTPTCTPGGYGQVPGCPFPSPSA
jgi:hypothetical protein